MSMDQLYNKLQERYWQLKHDNIAHMDGIKGYEHVDVTENYYRMQEIENICNMIEAAE